MLSPAEASKKLRYLVFDGGFGRFDPEDEKTVLELPFTRTEDFTDMEWRGLHRSGMLFLLTAPEKR
jgi:hypothetical protein